jgi:hypothetical protein
VSRLEELRFSQWGGPNDPAVNTLFMGAIIYGSDTLITEMLQHDIKVETLRTARGENVLHLLIKRASGISKNSRKNLFGVVQSIVNSHPQLLKERDNMRISPLRVAIFSFGRFYRSGEEPRELYQLFNYIVDVMEEQKEDIDQPDNYGVTNLMIAASSATPQVIHRLIQAGAHVDMVDNDGDTALMHACRDVIADNVRALLEHGADKDLQNKEGQTALRIAVENGNYAMAQMLMQEGAPARLNLKASNGLRIKNYANTADNIHNQNNQIKEDFLRTYSRKNKNNSNNSNNEKKNNQNGGKRKKRKTRRSRK